MMTYMTYNFFFALMTLLPIFIWFAVSLWVVLDADKMPAEAWTLAGESKNVWSVISILLMWPFGLIFYLFIVRKKVAAFARAINEDALIEKAADRLRSESESNTSEAKNETAYYEDDETEQDAVDNSKHLHDGVYDYEESDAREDFNDSEQTIPPKPRHQPTVGTENYTEDQDADKTAAYPVVPPRPTRSPRVGK